MKYAIATYILCLACCMAWGQQFAGRHLIEFEKLDAEHAREDKLIAAGNRFLAELYSNEFIDEPIQFDRVDTLRMNVYYWGAELMYDHQEYAEAVRLGLKAAPLFHEGDTSDIHSDCCSIIAVSYVRLGRFDDAAVYAKQCYDIDVLTGDHRRIASSLNTLGAIYMSARQAELAEQYVMHGIEECGKTDNLGLMAVLKGMASEVYHHQGRDSLSLQYADEALDIDRQLDRKSKIAIRQAQRASALIGLHRYDEALKALGEAIPQLRADGNDQSLGIADIQMGHLLLASHQNEEAAQYLAEAIGIFSRHHDLYNESAAQKAMAEALRADNPSEALVHLERYNQLHDSIYDSETGLLLSQYHANYEVEQLQASLNAEHTTRNILFYVIAAILLLIAAGVFVTWRRSIRHQREIYRKIESRFAAIGAKHLAAADKETDGVLETRPADSVSPEDEFLLRLTDIVEQHCQEGSSLGVESLASALGMTPYQLRQRLADCTDAKPLEFIQSIRMKRACYMLDTQPQLTISEIAYRLGYEDKSNFTRAFKRMNGMTPSEYLKRASHKGSEK